MMNIEIDGKELGPVASLLAILAFGAIVAFSIGAIYKRMEATSECLQAGYPSSRMDWQLKTYCVKRQDQTDIVVPLAEVRK